MCEIKFAVNLKKPDNPVMSFAKKHKTKIYEKPAQATWRTSLLMFLLRKKYYMYVSHV